MSNYELGIMNLACVLLRTMAARAMRARPRDFTARPDKHAVGLCRSSQLNRAKTGSQTPYQGVSVRSLMKDSMRLRPSMQCSMEAA